MTQPRRFFFHVTRLRWPILAIGLAGIIWAGIQLPKIVKDTTADSFIDPDSPALVYRKKIEDLFGLKDPIVVAVVDRGQLGIYKPESLALVQKLTEQLRQIEFVDPERVTSLATENNIVGVEDGLVAEGFFEIDPESLRGEVGSDERAASVRQAVANFPLLQGSLVSRDTTTAIIVAELLDESEAPQAYDAVKSMIDSTSRPLGVEVHVAGEGAVSGFLAEYIDRDAKRLNPVAGVIITLILAAGFMSLRAAMLPNLIVAATAVGALGVMASSGVSFYVITNGLIVNLIGIAVADSIHVLSSYYETRRDFPVLSRREATVEAMAIMWRPITLTTVTTIAGFLALSASSVMPPVQYFGLFGALGVGIAWLYSMTVLPATLTLWPSDRIPKPFLPAHGSNQESSRFSRWLRNYGRWTLAHPKSILIGAGIAIIVAFLGLSKVVVDEARIENFKRSEPIAVADRMINASMDGTYGVDVLVETVEPDGLYEPVALKKVEALQEFLMTLEHVNGATSIVDYIKQLHRAVNEGRDEEYRIPDDPLLISQLFFLYNASADPTDFEEEVDDAYQRALVTAKLDVGRYSVNREIVPHIEEYLNNTFNDSTIRGVVTGRVTVDYYWIKGIGDSNTISVLLSFAAVLAVSTLLFRSIAGGLLASLPVAAAVLVVFAVMGFMSIPLGVGTSMFSAIAIGLSIDFAIHTLDRVKDLVRIGGFDDETLVELFPSTGRALLLNFIAVAAGFGVLTTSDVPPLVKFGGLVAVAVSVAFIASVTLIPTLVKVIKPRFLVNS